jgi:uncharacterized protein YbcI
MPDERFDDVQPADAVTGEAADALAASDGPGADLRHDISNAMVSMKKEFYGKGPVKAKTYLNDNYVFCAMEGGLTRNEETLLAAGDDDVVRQYRLHFQAAVTESATGAIEKITGRKVIGYHSQIVFRPTRVFEIFVLDAPPDSPAGTR